MIEKIKRNDNPSYDPVIERILNKIDEVVGQLNSEGSKSCMHTKHYSISTEGWANVKCVASYCPKCGERLE